MVVIDYISVSVRSDFHDLIKKILIQRNHFIFIINRMIIVIICISIILL